MNLISVAVRTFLALCSPRTAELARGAHHTAPSYLTADAAMDHAEAAVIAAAIYDVDPALLLSIGWHESRYDGTEITPEVGGKFSCGPMTPEPLTSRAACERATSTLLGGYLAGAAHLRTWIDMMRGNMRMALLGYAGGGHLIHLCQWQELRACHTPEVFEARARWIRAVSPA